MQAALGAATLPDPGGDHTNAVLRAANLLGHTSSQWDQKNVDRIVLGLTRKFVNDLLAYSSGP
jgi:hypothetical protein